MFEGFYHPEQVAQLRATLAPEFAGIFAADPAAVRAKLGAPLEGSVRGPKPPVRDTSCNSSPTTP